MAGVRSEEEPGHEVIFERLGQLEDRADKQDAVIQEIRASAQATAGDVAYIKGSIDGALKTKKLGGAMVGVLLTISASTIIVLIVALIKASGGRGIIP